MEEAPLLATAALGAAGSGTYFHQHDAALNFLLHGQKRWLLYSPLPLRWGDRAGFNKAQTFLNPGYSTTAELLEQVPTDPRLSKRLLDGTDDKRPGRSTGRFEPHTCVQAEGDLLFVPGLWHHATINLAETVGVVFREQFIRPMDVFREYGDYEVVRVRLRKDAEKQTTIGLTLNDLRDSSAKMAE